MSEARVEVVFGNVKFSAEGSETWVESRLESFLLSYDELGKHVPDIVGKLIDQDKDAGQKLGPLAVFLKERNNGANQNARFLATAVWLKRSGSENVKTADVVKALAAAQQQRLGNPADILNQNVRKGYCVKTADGFYVTPEGEESLKL